MERSVPARLMLLLGFLLLSNAAAAAESSIPPYPLSSPSYPPDLSTIIRRGPTLAPSHSPKRHAMPSLEHRPKVSPEFSPSSNLPGQGQECGKFACAEPLTQAPYGSPCGCVYPVEVIMDLGIAPFKLFPQIAELEIEIAAGIYMKQSQVRIMAANVSERDLDKTSVTIYLLPLGEKFDDMTAFLTFQRLWQKKVLINRSLFGDYDVIDVHYPGLPSSPPHSGVSSGPSDSGSRDYPITADVPASKSRRPSPMIIGVVVLSSVIFFFILVGAIFVSKWRKGGRPLMAVGPMLTPSVTGKSGIKSMLSSSITSSTSTSLVSTMGTCKNLVKRYSLAELEKATDNFSPKRILGEGGFGRVYHGIFEDGSVAAIKLITREDHNGDREFAAEVEMLSRLHHRNLVKLIGICIEGRRRCLVYELICNGSVESHLHGSDKRKGEFDWEARLKIALGAARALAYLHEDSNPRVIHRDFKSSNVLLEEDFTPKVSDFGLAREASEGNHHISTQVMGTFGYVAPEYAMTGHLLVKSDVYSYGVVLLELISGRKPVYMSQSQGPENLVTWARPLLASREGLEQLVDPSLGGKYDFEDMAKVAAIASTCVHIEASQRPFMGEVVQALKLICNEMDETCGDSYSQRGSSAPDCDFKGDLGLDHGWWNGDSTPRLNYGYASSFVTLQYSSGPMEGIRRPHTTNTLIGRMENVIGHNRSGPLRTKRKKSAFQKLRGTVSEHGHLSKHLGFDGF